jgi:hypothetical protein
VLVFEVPDYFPGLRVLLVSCYRGKLSVELLSDRHVSRENFLPKVIGWFGDCFVRFPERLLRSAQYRVDLVLRPQDSTFFVQVLLDNLQIISEIQSLSSEISGS